MYNNDYSRRNFFRQACCGSPGIAGTWGLWVAHAADARKTSLSADQALAVLKKGNADFLLDRPSVAANQRASRRLEIAPSQAPFAVLVGCSDSRVPPEDLFGAGLGECSSCAMPATRWTRRRWAASSTACWSSERH